MKVIQLGNFRARVEAKYDEEIEEYRRKLEDSYQLCQQCQRHLNKTLNRIKTKFIGSKISQLVTKGIQIVGSPVTKKNRQIISKMAMVAVFVLSVVNLMRETNIDLDFLRSINHQYVITAYCHIVALFLTIVDLSKSLLNEMQLSYLTEINTDSIATSAVLLNSSIFLSQKKVQLQIMLSMMFWSLKMILSELPIDAAHILAVKGSLAVVLVLISIHMLFKSQEEKKPTVGPNGSFHKIAEVQDDSDNEVDTTDSSIINSSYAPALTRFKSCIREGTLLAPASTSSFAESLQGKSFHNSTVRRSATDGTRTMDMLSNRSFSIRQEVATADRHQVHNDINKLNISGKLFGSTTSTLKDFNVSKNLNPFSLANSRCGSPTPSLASVFSGSYRSQVISPPQLHTCPAEANNSWVAGGYWQSPRKRFLERNSGLIQPETSRSSSSQSSGLGTFDSGKNSRDNSIHGDETLSIFSEPVQRRNLFGKPADARSLYLQPFSPLAPKVTTNFFFNTTACDFGKYRDGNSSFYK